MTLMSKEQFKQHIKKFPNGGVIFSEYDDPFSIHITLDNSGFGAKWINNVCLDEDLIFVYDWNVDESMPDNMYYVFELEDVESMIFELSTANNILKEDK